MSIVPLRAKVDNTSFPASSYILTVPSKSGMLTIPVVGFGYIFILLKENFSADNDVVSSILSIVRMEHIPEEFIGRTFGPTILSINVQSNSTSTVSGMSFDT